MLSSPKGYILYVSQTFSGSVHDKKIADLQNFNFKNLTIVLADLGFKGYKNNCVKILMPFKKTKKQELTLAEKEYNKKLAAQRVCIEHVFAHIKTWRVVKETLRCFNFFYRHFLFVLACKLHNFRTHFRLNPYSA